MTTDVEDEPPTGEQSTFEQLLCFDLYAASRAVTAAYRPLLDELGLTYPQYLVLTVLDEQGSQPIKSLAATLRLDHATLTPLLRRLEDRGLLQRRRSDRDERSVLVDLSAEGKEVAVRFDDVRCRIGEVLGVTSDEARTLRALLRGVSERAHESLR